MRAAALLVALLLTLCQGRAAAQACGHEGEAACPIPVRVPSCFPYLVEVAGRCLHPDCGREGQVACTVFVRIPSCDANLAEVAGLCVQPTPCGHENERACRVWEHVPSCLAPELVERAGLCVHPACGREGDAPCVLTERIPSCDTGLVESSGRCVLPTPCGAEGQRECKYWEFPTSCRSRDLVDTRGTCVHPACGRDGDAACDVATRIPSCDAGLVEDAGHCRAPTPCGDEGQRACWVWEHVPSCLRPELVESAGRCVHPACGREGDVACDLGRRALACDTGLVEVGGRCAVPTPCGGEGERACGPLESLSPCKDAADVVVAGVCRHPACGREGESTCAPSTRPAACDAGLVARGAQCLHPPCGRDGESPCTIAVRVPSCDPPLVERDQRCRALACGHPGTRQCLPWERTSSCDDGSAAQRGQCVLRSACGGAGQRGCTLVERPGLAACTAGLVEIPGCTGDCFGSSGTCGDLSRPMPEPGTGLVATTPGTDPMRGYADVHVHMFSHLAFGGGVFAGRPYDATSGAAAALRPDYATTLDLVSFLGTDLPIVTCPATQPGCGRVSLHGEHLPVDDTAGLGTEDGTGSNFGAPVFNGWPTWHATTHQQVYQAWLERAWRGGLRLMVMLAVNNEVLCRTSKRVRGTDCGDTMAVIDAQLREARAFEAWMHARPGGAGNWFVIVESPDAAEAAIRAGKLAVVLGIEADSLFGCRADRRCNHPYLRRQVKHYRELGVRHVFPTHDFDNGLAGTAVWMDTLNLGNRILGNRWYAVGPCDTSDFVLSRTLPGRLGPGINAVLNEAQSHLNLPYPAYPDAPGCNVQGLSASGHALMVALMNAGVMIDIDHMSHRAVADALGIAERRGGYPLSVGHGLFADVHGPGGRRHERMRTDDELRRLAAHGGVVSVMTQDELEVEGVFRREDGSLFVDDCKHSSRSFALNYLHAAAVTKGPIAFGSDFNGLAPHVGPRYGDDGCGHDDGQWARQQGQPRLAYPFTLPGFGVFDAQVTGQRRFDFNTDGLAHIGLLPDLIADMRTVGVTDAELEPLFQSAHAYVDAWRQAERIAAMPVHGPPWP